MAKKKPKKLKRETWVFKGLRIGSKRTLVAAFQPVRDGKLVGDELWYKRGGRINRLAIGWTYSVPVDRSKGGALVDFGEIERREQFPDRDSRINWEYAEEAAKTEVAAIRAEKKIQSIRELDTILEPIRQLHFAAKTSANRAALEAAVLRLIGQTPKSLFRK